MNSRNLTILIAEDDENDVTLLRLALTRLGINNPVHVSHDGVEAIEYLERTAASSDRAAFPSIFITDLKMPRLGGLEVIKWVRAHPACKLIPVLVLSASKEARDVKMAYELGANSYMVKPSTFEDLQQMLKAVYDYWCWCEKPTGLDNC